MALKDSWVDKKDEVDYILAEDINAIAHGVIDIEENLPETIDEKLGEAKESGEFDGKDGLSAYELALKNGTTTAESEAEWLASLKGTDGHDGVDGKDGNDGIDGERGLAYYRLKSNLVGSLEYYPFTDFLIPEDYVPKPYDLVLYNDGNLGYISSVSEYEQLAAVSHIPNAGLKGPAGTPGFSPTVSVSKKDGVATISITDENGTQTVQIYDGAAGSGTGGSGGDWSVNNPAAAGYIKNRTHYKEIAGVVIFSEPSLAFEDTLGSFTMAELADSIDLEEGKTYKVSWGGVDYACVAQKDPVIGNGLYLGNGRDINDATSTEPFLIRTTKEGSYNTSSGKTEIRNYAQTYNIALEISAGEETIYHQLDPKYIPHMYYTEERNDVEILPTSTAVSIDNPMMGELYIHGDPITLVEGKTYKVTYNGVEYECVATALDFNGVPSIALGDVGMLATGAPSGDYPFLLGTNAEIVNMGLSAMILALDGTSSITVSIVGYGTIIHKVPDTYLPKTPVVNFEKYGARIDSNLTTSQRLTNEALEELLSNIAAVSDKIEIHVNDLARSTPNGIPVKLTFYKTEMCDYYQEPEYEFACPTFGGVHILHWGTGDGFISLTVRQYK